MGLKSCDELNSQACPVCPLCLSDDLSSEGKIDTRLIVNLYGSDLQAVVRNEFRTTTWLSVYRCRGCSLCFFWPILPGSPQFYAGLKPFEWSYTKEKAEYEMAKKWVTPDTHLLEVGCGAGWFGKKLSGVKYTGIEYSELAVEQARNGGLDVRKESIEEHSLHNKYAYQVVCSFQVLEHVANPASFIAGCLDCLETGGLLVCAVPSDDSYLRFLENASSNLPPHHLTRWPDRTLEALPRLFPVSLVALEHESVSDIHLELCVRTIIRRQLDVVFGRKEAMVDRSLSARILNRCAHFMSRWGQSLLDDERVRPRGHTVIATYRKNKLADSVPSRGSL
jgi:SAM-dependent methyltransferase